MRRRKSYVVDSCSGVSMTSKPGMIDSYGGDSLALVRATSLYVATKLGDMLDDIVIVGGLVPSLLVDQEDLPGDLELHPGTLDLDMGLSLAVLKEERYRELGLRLRDAGFEPDLNPAGNPTSQRWRTRSPISATVDFLIPPSLDTDQGGNLRHIEPGFAALITPGLHIAFKDRRRLTLSGQTILGERTARHVWVCGPAAFTVLKALAFRNRGTNKDAYDLVYTWRGLGIETVARDFASFLDDPCVDQALAIIEEDFTDHDAPGPRRAAAFLGRATDDELQADVVGLARRLLSRLARQ